MAVPFGFSAGDCVAVVKLTGKVVSELKEVGLPKSDLPQPTRVTANNNSQSGEAPVKYQNLLVQLELLQRALSKLNDIKPAANDLKHLEAIRAGSEACRRPLETFLERVSKFDKALGSWDAKEKRFRGVGKRIQYSVAFEKEVKELRTTLAGHLSTITMLLAAQSLDSLVIAQSDQTSSTNAILGQCENIADDGLTTVSTLKAVASSQEGTNQLLDAQKTALNASQQKADHIINLHSEDRAKLEEQLSVLRDVRSEINSVRSLPEEEDEDGTPPNSNRPVEPDKSTSALAAASNILSLLLSGTMLVSANNVAARARELSAVTDVVVNRTASIRGSPRKEAEHCRWNDCRSHHLGRSTIEDFLKKKFGNYNFRIMFSRNRHWFRIPRDLTAIEHQELSLLLDDSAARDQTRKARLRPASKGKQLEGFSTGEKVWLRNTDGIFEEEVHITDTCYDTAKQKWMYVIKDLEGTPFLGNFDESSLKLLNL